MYILPVSSINTKKNTNLNFTSCIRTYSPKTIGLPDIFQKNQVLTTSNCFRGDLNWKKLLSFINWHFIDKEKVNIHCMACADGAEPTSYAIGLDKYNLDKYSIFASDIDIEILKPATEGKIVLVDEDIKSFDYLGINMDYYFKKCGSLDIPESDSKAHSAYKIVPEIRNAINYRQTDILEHLNSIDDHSNSVVNIRNVMPYLKASYVDKIIEMLGYKLKKDSLFIYGNYDRNIPYLLDRLNDFGFRETTLSPLVVQKIM